jgi:hypothetical protein
VPCAVLGLLSNSYREVALSTKNRSSGLYAMWKPLQAKRIGGAPTSTLLSGPHLFASRRGTHRVSGNSGRQGVSRAPSGGAAARRWSSTRPANRAAGS